MEKNIACKVARYIELSKEFSKKEEEIFGEDEKPEKTVYLSSYPTFNTINTLEVKESSDEEKPTRGQIIIKKAYKEKAKADRYDEFIELQKELEEYFRVIINFQF